ncbi:glycoside hydrolase family 2 protein, partial [Salmonella enterica]|nr:glycoside hydrolase family 2 protein [Salmonella enterica]
HLWSPDSPYLYTLRTEIDGGKDLVETKVGLRTLEWSVDDGFKINGSQIEIVGADLHLDHAGVGTAVLKELWCYKIKKLKALGMNAIRLSHNPGTPAMLDACDSLGMLIIDENRLMGVNDEHLGLLRRMIERDRNHPSVILWSIGNEEWWIESGDKGEKIARTMIDFARTVDSTRLYTYGNSGGFGLTRQVDIHGYNYIVQNDVDNRHKTYPDWVVVGTEETSGCGTRGVYETDSLRGWMKSINYEGEDRPGREKNVIERGWKFYRDNAYAAGLFYWTGFDYRGEPNPMKWPATGSQFGILDYCGFPKDEAFYLKAAWTAEPVLHILPHWNLKGREGQSVEVWAYSNMDEVELLQDGKSLGRQKMDKDSHLVWNVTYKPGRLEARGFKNGKRVITRRVETTGPASQVSVEKSKETI